MSIYLSACPALIYIVLIMMVMGSNVKSVIIAQYHIMDRYGARVVRSEVFLQERRIRTAARLCGQSSWRILISAPIPNSMGPIIVSTAFLIPNAIFSEAFLLLLGIGIAVPQASWARGERRHSYIMSQPYQMFFLVLVICLTMFSLNFIIGDGLRVTHSTPDSKSKKQKEWRLCHWI